MIIGAGLQLACAMVLTRHLNTDVYGQYVFVLGIIALLSTVASGGGKRLIQRQISRSVNKEKKLSSEDLGAAILSCGLITFAAAPFVLSIGVYGNIEISYFGVLLIVICAFIRSTQSILDGALIGFGQPALSAVFEMVSRPVLVTIAVLAIAWVFGADAERDISKNR